MYEITKKELQELYDKKGVQAICERLGNASKVYVYKLLKEAGIPLTKRKPKRVVSVKIIG